MNKTISSKLNIFIILLILTAVVAICSSGAFAASAPSATGQVDFSGGIVLRKSPTVYSKNLGHLKNNTKITIYKEIFKTKKSTSSNDIWLYISANGQKGYIKACRADNIKYSNVSGKITTDVNYRKGAGIKMKYVGTLNKGEKVTVVLLANPVNSAKGSSLQWYKIRSGSKYYYVCSSKVQLIDTEATSSASQKKTSYSNYISAPSSNMEEEKFEEYLKKQGFPEEYKVKLRKLHKAHPNWGFVAYHTNIKWADALSRQNSGGTSLVSGVYPSSYRNGSKQYEKGWYKASSSVVAFYMDPRNFLDENSIYMFEDLSYKPSYQTASVTAAILAPTRLPGYGFTGNLFVNAAAANNVSPVFLAARARQETGNGGDAVNGTKILGKKVYNPFNIGAFGGTNPLYNGLLYAYAKGWTTPALAINGGAQELAKNYINQGQYTGYYQRFNVRNGAGKVGTHQYMTNIMAPFTEARSTKDSYTKYGLTGQSLVFEIPVYTAMPASTKLP